MTYHRDPATTALRTASLAQLVARIEWLLSNSDCSRDYFVSLRDMVKCEQHALIARERSHTDHQFTTGLVRTIMDDSYVYDSLSECVKDVLLAYQPADAEDSATNE